MDPARKFHKLSTAEENLIIEFLQLGSNPTCCDICGDGIFERSICDNTCPFKNKTCEDALVESYIPLTLYLAKRYKANDSVGAALLALIRAIRSIPDDLRDINAWIKVWVTGYLKNNMKADRKQKIYCNPDQDCTVLGTQTLVDLNEILSTIPKTDKEKIIMDCVTGGGYSLDDMSILTNLGIKRVSQIKQDIEQRIWEELTQ